MTLHEITNQLYSLSDGHCFNGEKHTKKWLGNYLKHWFSPEVGTTRWIMEIKLPDGWWYFEVSRFSDRQDGFDYYIPDTRQQEAAVKAVIGL